MITAFKRALFLGICVTSITTSIAYSAPVQWNTGLDANGHWYELVNNHGILDWNTANSYASASEYDGTSGYLGTFTSEAEATWVYDTLIAPLLSYPYSIITWLGGYRTSTDPEWKWVTGEEWTYDIWYPGEPNNTSASVDCVMLTNVSTAAFNIHTGAQLADAPWNWSQGSLYPGYYLVEYDGVVVPEPTTIMLLLSAICGIYARKSSK